MKVCHLAVFFLVACLTPAVLHAAPPAAADLPPASPLIAPEVLTAPPASPDHAPKLLIYLAKGNANACGPGCDRWIAIEGNVDKEAAPRIIAFLRANKEKQRPIYFHSPGGALEPALPIARTLRALKAAGRVGRTTVKACAAAAQIDEACLKLKTTGGELEAEVTTEGAMCNSACAYIFLGPTRREVAPDAALGVHDSKLFVKFRAETTLQQRAVVEERLRAKSKLDVTSLVAEMGIERSLMDLIRSVPYEKGHRLTRAELHRFGIDTRPFVETPWNVAMLPKPHLRKKAEARKDDGSFRVLEWRLNCTDTTRGLLLFIREVGMVTTGARGVTLNAGSEKPVVMNPFPAGFATFEVWQASLTMDAMAKLVAEPSLAFGESAFTGGQTVRSSFDIETRGLQDGWSLIAKACPDPRRVPSRPVQFLPGPTGGPPKTVVWPTPAVSPPR